jgi:hypothetical protein
MVQGWASWASPPHVSIVGTGAQHGGVRPAAATSRRTKWHASSLLWRLRGVKGEGVEQAMDAGIHQIDRFDFGFNGLEMNSSSVSNVLDEMLH